MNQYRNDSKSVKVCPEYASPQSISFSDTEVHCWRTASKVSVAVNTASALCSCMWSSSEQTLGVQRGSITLSQDELASE